MNNNLEQYLQSFRLKEPSVDLEYSVRAAAVKHWREQSETPFSASFVFGVKIFFTAAAIMLTSIIVLNLLTFPKMERDMNKKAEIEQLVSLGIPKSNAAVMIAAMEAGGRKTSFKQQQIIGDIL
ncbi:MAG: hypothetical protein WCI51_03160 [Lentisphaerota bacterium]